MQWEIRRYYKMKLKKCVSFLILFIKCVIQKCKYIITLITTLNIISAYVKTIIGMDVFTKTNFYHFTILRIHLENKEMILLKIWKKIKAKEFMGKIYNNLNKNSYKQCVKHWNFYWEKKLSIREIKMLIELLKEFKLKVLDM